MIKDCLEEDTGFVTKDDMNGILNVLSANPERTAKAYEILKAHNAVAGPIFEEKLLKAIAEKNASKDISGEIGSGKAELMKNMVNNFPNMDNVIKSWDKSTN